MPTLKAFQKTDMPAEDLQKLARSVDLFQDNAGKLFTQLRLNPAIVPNAIIGVKFNSGQDVYVNHGLGTAFQGYLNTRIYDCVGLPLYFESDTLNKSPDKYIIFKALGTFTANFLVY